MVGKSARTRGMPKRIGRFEVIREIGRGEMGVVYEAVDSLIERQVAIKTFHFANQQGDDQQIVEMFLREARSAGRLSHPNIVTIFDAGQAKGFSYIVMELLPGRSLRQILDDGSPIAFDWLVNVGFQLADALGYAHRAGVIHRDIKPANIMVDEQGNAKLTDFSIARVSCASRTQHGMVLGTPQYMSPEQVRGQELDGRSDVFSLGAVLFEALTGRPPFGDGDDAPLISVLEQIVYSPAPPPSKLNDSVPRALDMIVGKALSKEPADRYATANDLGRDLRQFKKLLMPGKTGAFHRDSPAWLESARFDPALPIVANAQTAANVPVAEMAPPVAAPAPKPLKTFMATVMYASIVGFANAPLGRQAEMKQQFATALNESLRRIADEDRMLIDTGDGVAVSLHGDPLQILPVAMYLQHRLKSLLRLSIGLHCGPVRLTTDAAGKLSLVGEALSIAQRMVSVARHGEALASRALQEVLCGQQGQHSQRFRPIEQRYGSDGQMIEACPVSLAHSSAQSATNEQTESNAEAAMQSTPRTDNVSSKTPVVVAEPDLASSLEADIDAFSRLSEEELLARTDTEKRMLNAGRRSLIGTGEFPRLVEAHDTPAAPRNLQQQQTAMVAPQAAANTTPIAQRTSLLAQLSAQANKIQEHNDHQARGRQAALTEIEELVPARMREAYTYVHDLVTQLNVIQPDVPRNYPLLGLGAFKGLKWVSGDTDFRTRGADGPDMMNQVSIGFTLNSNDVLSAEREGPAIEKLRHALHDHGLEYSEEQARNDRHRVEHSRFTVQSNIRARIVIAADYRSTRLTLRTRNLERLGIIEYTIEARDMNTEFLDELAKSVLGQPNRLFAYLQTANPLTQGANSGQ